MLIDKLRHLLKPVLLLFSNTVWLFSAEILSKVSRVLTIIVLAGTLTPISYGTAFLALACHDMLALILRAGAGAQIIRCDDKQLRCFARNGATIQWGICLSLATIQYCMSDFVASWYDNPDLALLLQTMAATYLFYPWVSIKIFLLQRANRMRQFSICNGICITMENVSIAVFAWWQADFMAVAYGKIVFSILWLILFSFIPVKSYGIGFDVQILKDLLRTSSQLFSCEFLRSLRLYADIFIAGKIMSPELFGLYSFAKNAGIGLSQSIGNVFNGALYPFLCKLQRSNTLQEHQRIIYLVALGVGSIFIMQAVMVKYYVPILFDDKWHAMIPVVTIMCLTALPSLMVDTYCSFERARSHFKLEISTRFICLSISLLLLFLLSPTQPMDFALVMVLSSLLWCLVIYFGHSSIHKILNSNMFFNRRKPNEY